MHSNPPLRRVLVAGASGFIGACAVRRLLALGHEVHALVPPKAQPWRLREIREAVRFHEADVADAERLRATIEASAPDAVLHLAAYGAYEWQAEPRRIFETNVWGSYNLFSACAALGVRVVVSAGSSSEYGYRSDPMRETDRLEPNSLYAVGKAAQTHLAQLAPRGTGHAVVTFRLFSVYGPWEEPARLMPTVIRRAQAGQPLEMVAPETARDFVYVDDVLDAMLAFERLQGLGGEVFNLGSGVQSTMRDVVEVVREVVGSGSEVRWGKMPARRWDTHRWQADVAKAGAVLGWSPRVSLREGVSRLAEWMRSRGEEYGPG